MSGIHDSVRVDHRGMDRTVAFQEVAATTKGRIHRRVRMRQVEVEAAVAVIGGDSIGLKLR